MTAKCAETKGNERKIIENTQALLQNLRKSASKPARNDNALHPGKADASPQARAQEDQLKCASKLIRKIPTNSTNQMNTSRAKSFRQSTTIKTKSHEEIKCRDGKKVIPSSETCGASILRDNSRGDQPFKQIAKYCQPYCEGREYRESMADSIDQRVRSGDVMPKASQHGNSSSLLENALQIAETSSIGQISDKEDDITYFLLTCQSFSSSAKEHFSLHPSKSLYCQSNITKDVGAQNAKLFFNVSEELMARRSHWHKHRCSPFLQTHRLRGTTDTSLDKLVHEIGNAIKELATYSTGDIIESRLRRDLLYIRLEKDLQFEDITMKSIWDIGWLNDVCLKAAEEVIDRIGDSILSANQ